ARWRRRRAEPPRPPIGRLRRWPPLWGSPAARLQARPSQPQPTKTRRPLCPLPTQSATPLHCSCLLHGHSSLLLPPRRNRTPKATPPSCSISSASLFSPNPRPTAAPSTASLLAACADRPPRINTARTPPHARTPPLACVQQPARPLRRPQLPGPLAATQPTLDPSTRRSCWATHDGLILPLQCTNGACRLGLAQPPPRRSQSPRSSPLRLPERPSPVPRRPQHEGSQRVRRPVRLSHQVRGWPVIRARRRPRVLPQPVDGYRPGFHLQRLGALIAGEQLPRILAHATTPDGCARILAQLVVSRIHPAQLPEPTLGLEAPPTLGQPWTQCHPHHQPCHRHLHVQSAAFGVASNASGAWSPMVKRHHGPMP
ncbi:hypothetical protein TCAP_04442, partial [Tolypocladium capitatum]